MSVVRSGFQGDQDFDEQLIRVAEEHSVSILVEERIVALLTKLIRARLKIEPH